MTHTCRIAGTCYVYIKITGPSGVVYDNQIGQTEDSDAATALKGGSIVIHTR